METQGGKVRIARSYGERNGNARLTRVKVQQIRNLYATGTEACRSLAERFNIGRQTVHDIIERVTWRGVAV